MGYVHDAPIEAAHLLDSVRDERCGGIVLFLGSVRRSEADGPVAAIDYSAYARMADEEFDRILDEAGARWSDARFAVRHRIGTVPLGEPSIGVAVAAPHRADAYDASRFVVDEAKRRLPVWKKERFDNGTSRWREENAQSASEAPRAAEG